jgi:DNA-binding LacI/PurR family transcriptional regulator
MRLVGPTPPENGDERIEARVRARLVDVAQQSGVSKSVVSRIMNDDDTLRIRDDTRERVLEVARQLGYRPHAGARALSISRAGALALLIPDLTNTVYATITRGAYRRARERGYVLLIVEDTPEDEGAVGDYAELVTSGRVDGLMVASARPGHPLVQRLVRHPDTVPHVFVNRTVDGSVRNVGVDMRAASAFAVSYLAGRGHSRIGMVAGPADLSPASARIEGFRDGMLRLGLPADHVESGDFSEPGGYEAALRLLGGDPALSAVYASSFGQAVGVMKAARELGLDIPRRLSLIGYDDLPAADFVDPPLTTVSMPMAELGAAAVDAIVGQLEYGTPAPRVVEGGYRVIERGSVSAPSAPLG